MGAVPLPGKTAVFIVFGLFALGGQTPPPPDKPAPVAPTIRLPLSKLKPDATIDLGGERVLIAGDAGIWVSRREAGTVSKIDGKTNKPADPLAVGKEPCSSLATAFGSLIVPLCGAPGLARVDLKTNAITNVKAVVTSDAIGPVTGVSSIWLITGGRKRLIRIDPETNTVVADVPLNAKALAMTFAQNSLWISTEENEVLKINPYTIVTGEPIKVGKSPVSMALGEGALWTLNAGDGSISRVDLKTNRVATIIKLGVPIARGQIAVGEGSIWVSAPGVPLIRIDPRTNHVAQQFSGEGGGAVLVAQGAIWITATPTAIWRLDPKLIEATRQ